MDEPQLPLFDKSAMVMGEGYRRLAAFKFKEAEQYFRKVRQTGEGEEEEITQALHACTYWQALVELHKENPDACPAENLYDELCRYAFGKMPGLYQLKEALLQYIAERLLAEGRFLIHTDDWKGETVTDLLMELNHYKKAEKAILLWIERRPADAQFRYALAQIEWLNKLKGEAKKNYARGLLLDPCRVPYHRILYKQLTTLIEDVGAEMAPVFGWVRGVLPLVPMQENLNICSESHHRALECYRLIRSANMERTKNKDKDAFARYKRKLDKLKVEAPGLFDEYLALYSDQP